ncbi:DUF6934 family protein [Dyadobacter arcticus]|uniref:Uncharacterized protein n=1 Tax=Dyadobacter arcticus TaxID=1078754 RepID=A0ABX0UGS5_9BACT|nr:hypothetical protein [Dyadobacter arcticus]NIJ51703.1 hypothetical protein [Dyadobacter arcticus]
MASSSNTYEVREERSSAQLEYVFISVGRQIVPKIIQYTLTHQFEDRDVYNLGFGDYNDKSDQIEDHIKSGNGDAYKVFNTVLSTIPLFFERFADAILIVQGSDGGPDFIEKCQRTCIRKCHLSCRKFNQRVAIYRNFVEKHFSALSYHYWFLGGYTNDRMSLTTEKYILGRAYNAILMFKK